MAALTRKDLKTDRFAQEVGHTVEYVGEHRAQIVRYGAVALVILILGIGVYFYRQHQQAQRQQELASAIRIQESPVGSDSPGASYPTQQAKEEAALKAFSDLTNKLSGTDEGHIAQYYRGAILADQGKLQEAEASFKTVAADAGKNQASLAKLALIQIYLIGNRNAEAEKMGRDLLANPTDYVSKEQATFALARALARTNPAEARKLLEPLRSSRSAVSQAAIQLYAELIAP